MSKTNDEIWKIVLDEMQTKVSQANFHTLFKNTYLLTLDDSIATVAAPSTMIIDLLQKRFAADIQRILSEQSGTDVSLVFVPKVMPNPNTGVRETQDDSPLFVPNDSHENTRPQQKQIVVGHLPRVRPDYTFQSFAVSASNQLAFVSSQTVAENIGRSYNPLFLYGPVGVGKTHLMHAVANDVYQKDPTKKILYVTSEEFTNEVIEAIRTNDTAKMKRKFRSAFLLLIDDIQFIEGKERVQEELFHTFNILIDQGSQICLSSDRPPHEIKKLEKRLSSRFAGGLTVDISVPDFELKAAILGIKAKKFGHEVPSDVISFLADRAEDTRSLEGLLLRVITQATTGDKEINLELAQKALGHMVEEKKQHLHADDIINLVCDYYKIKQTQLKGPKRNAALVKARQITMYLIHKELRLTLVEIGNLLGGRDHTTVIHGVEKIEKLVENKAQVTEDILGITKSLRG